MNPQKLVNCVAVGLFLMNVLLMYMIIAAFRADYDAFENRIASQPEKFSLVLERLLELSKRNIAQFPTIESSFLGSMLEDAHCEKVLRSHKAYPCTDNYD